MKGKLLKGKHLKVGMHVCMEVGRSNKGERLRRRSALPLTVMVIEWPYVVFEYEQDAPTMTIGPIKLPSPGELQETVPMDVRGCRFREVSSEYVQALRKGKSKPEPEVWDDRKDEQ